MNEKIVHFLKNIIDEQNVGYTLVSEKTGIDCQRLTRIFDQDAVISGSELICISRALGVKHSELMALLDSAA